MNAVHEFGNSVTKRLPKGETKTLAQQNIGEYLTHHFSQKYYCNNCTKEIIISPSLLYIIDVLLLN